MPLDDRVEWARVTVHKPDAPIAATFSDVALTITRARAPVTETPNPNIIDADTLTGEMRPIRRAVLSLGPTSGSGCSTLQGAVDAIADTPDVWVTGVSPVYETEPVDARRARRTSSTPSCWPTPPSPPNRLLERALAVEDAYDRERSESPQRAAHPGRRPDRGR